MARITIEDCTKRVSNRFHLVQMASIRSKQLKKGARSLVQTEGNKEVVTALREIAAGKFEIDDSQVIAEDRWKPVHRQRNPEPVDDELPPEA